MLVRVRVGKARLQHKFYLSAVDTIEPSQLSRETRKSLSQLIVNDGKMGLREITSFLS